MLRSQTDLGYTTIENLDNYPQQAVNEELGKIINLSQKATPFDAGLVV